MRVINQPIAHEADYALVQEQKPQKSIITNLKIRRSTFFINLYVVEYNIFDNLIEKGLYNYMDLKYFINYYNIAIDLDQELKKLE